MTRNTPKRHELDAGKCAITIEPDEQLRVIGPHTLSDAEERTLLTHIAPHVAALPTPRDAILYVYPAGRPHHGSITPAWETAIENNDDENNDEQTSLDQYNETDIEAYIQDEIKKALPEVTSHPLRFPTVF